MAGITIAVTTMWPTWWSMSAYLPSFSWGAWLGQVFIVNWAWPPYSFAWWSLTIEVLFYALLPLLILMFRAIRHQPAILFSVFCGTLLLSAVAYNSVPIAVIRNLVNYAPCFAAGLVLASQEVSTRGAYTALLSGIFLTIASTILPSVNPHIGWGLLYFGIVATALDKFSPLSKRLSSGLFVWLGERSYSLFLTHHTIIVLTYWAISLLVEAKGPTYYLATRSISVVSSLFVAMMLFNFVRSNDAFQFR